MIFTPLAHFHIPSFPLLQVMGVLLFMSRTKSLHCHWHFTDISYMGTWGWEAAQPAEAQNLTPLSTHDLKYLSGRCMHPNSRLVLQVLHPIIWPSIEKAHPLHEEAVMSLRNWVTTAGHFAFFIAVLKLGHGDTEQISSSDKGTEQTPSFNHYWNHIRSGANSKFSSGIPT